MSLGNAVSRLCLMQLSHKKKLVAVPLAKPRVDERHCYIYSIIESNISYSSCSCTICA